MSLQEFSLSGGDRRFLEARIESRTLPQTLLLEGGAEEQRHALALYLAAAIVCTGDGARPCGICRACVKCKAHSHPDIQLYAPEKKGSTFKVEVCRAIRQDAFLQPNDGTCKVYILEDSQAMNDSSENALLKILEEPPVGVYFILTCDSRSAMLPTVLSRATVVPLLGAVSAFSEQTLETACALAVAAAGGNELAILRESASLEKAREEIRQVLLCLSEIFAAALKQKSGGTAEEAEYAEAVGQLVRTLTKPKIYALWKNVQALTASAEHNANANLLLTGLCYRLRQATEN